MTKASRISVFVGLAGLLLVGCEDDPAATAPDADTREDASTTSMKTPSLSGADNGRTGGILMEPRFEIDGKIRGALKPNLPIHISLNARGLHSSQQAYVSIQMPEVETAKRSEFGPGYTVVSGQNLPPAARRARALSRGQSSQITTTVTVPSPGYYRVVLGAKKTASETANTDRWIRTAQYETRWMWISQQGGQVTETFEADLFPDDAVVAPGPLRFREDSGFDPSRPRAAATNLQPAGFAAIFEHAGDFLFSRALGKKRSASTEVKFEYHNANTGSMEPASHLYYQVEWTDCQFWDYDGCEEQDTNGYLDADGTTSITCPDYYEGTKYVDVYAESRWVRAYRDGEPVPTNVGGFTLGINDCDGGGTITVGLADAEMAWVAAKTSTTAHNAWQEFGLWPATLTDLEADNNADISRYFPSDEKIVFDMDDIFGASGTWTLAHEYGHAYQHQDLGGLFRDFADNCDQHSYGRESSMGCAVSEGFADYFAEDMGDANIFFDENSHNVVNIGEDGAMVEGAVAAFFHDLTDGANEAHDKVPSYPYTYITGILQTCSVDGDKPSGIDHVIYCLEREIDQEVLDEYFPNRSDHPSSFSEGATEPSQWSQTDIRDLWTFDLYPN